VTEKWQEKLAAVIVVAENSGVLVTRLHENAAMATRLTGPRLVGRATELAVLEEVLGKVQAGEPATVLICGEAGAGKSRLVAELGSVARARRMRTLEGNCVVVGRTSLAFTPFAEALRPLATDAARAGTGIVRRGGMRLTHLLAAPGSGPGSDGPPTVEAIGEYGQLALFEDVLDALESVAVPNGLLLVIEDLHWADLSSRALFDFLCRNLRASSIALVATVRTDEPDDAGFLSWLAELSRLRHVLRVDLGPLSREDMAMLLAAVLGRTPPAELVRQVYERSGGNAFLAEELIAAEERGDVVPGTVRSVVLARMSGLSPSAQDLLRLAAVAGIVTGHRLLAAASGLDDDTMLAAVRELATSHLLVADRAADGFAFRHALTREAVYEDLLPGERQHLHGRLAKALSAEPALGPATEWARAEAVAEHWFAAGELERALATSVAAGKAARDILAVADALNHYERALQLWDQVSEPARTAGVERAVLLERLAEVASGDGDHDLAIRYIDEAIRDSTDSGAAPARLSALCSQKARYLWHTGRASELTEWTERAVTLSSLDPPTPEAALVLAEHAFALAAVERHDEALRVASAALEVAAASGAPRAEARARNALGVCLLMTETDAARGRREYERALVLARQIGEPDEVLYTYANLVDALARLGRYDEAAELAAEAAEAEDTMGSLRSQLGLLLLNGAEALLLAGRWKECDKALQRLRDRRAGGLVEYWRLAFSAIFEALRGNEEIAEAAIAEADGSGVIFSEGRGLLCAARAQVAINAGDLEAAHRHVFDSLSAFESAELELDVGPAALLAVVSLRIEADRALLGRIRHDATEEQNAIESVRHVAERTLALRIRACVAARRPAVTRFHQALCDAELGRAEGRSDPDGWRAAAEAGAAEHDRYLAAYAGYREAEAVLDLRGSRARAVAALEAANAIAHDLEAAPLLRVIEALARRARIQLGAEPSSSEAQPGQLSESEPLGLTRREIEVLRLIAAGSSNPDIGKILYISSKTASHHVSSILGKLGVSSRVEAAGIAHRLGLTADTAPK
jgi:predicted ATPase/DNA-binding CsgD family transcriptional regulator